MDQQANVQTPRRNIDIESLAASIKAAPPPPKELTKREAVQAVMPEIRDAMASGHTAASLSFVLQQDGLKVGARTLALWLAGGDAAPSKRRTKKKAARPTST
jgi:hypothetical protein